MKVQEMHGESTIRDTNATIMEEDGNDIGEQEMVLEEENTHKSAEIQNLAKSINDLAVLFKDLSVLVIE